MTVAPADLRTESRFRLPRMSTGWWLLGLAVVWYVGWLTLKGHDTLVLGREDLTGFQSWLGDISDSFGNAKQNNAVVSNTFSGISSGLNWPITHLQTLFSQPAFPRPVPQVGWLGVVALATWIGLAVAGVRSALLVLVTFLMFGFLGYWQDSIETLIVTFVSVFFSLLAGLPLGIWMARSKTIAALVTPVLDVMQTMPTFCYLLPLVLFFGIGPAAAVAATLIYALPPVARISAHGIRTVSESTLEATSSMGSTRGQLLRKVQLPMAKRTIIVGVNQTIMAALSMATITALIGAPGLGQPVLQALQTLDVGTAFVSGLAIVIMAIMLDRTTTAASVRAENEIRSGRHNRPLRRILLIAGGVVTAICIYLSHQYSWAAEFPDKPDLGTPLSDAAQSTSDWISLHLHDVTTGFTNAVSNGLLNPLQSLIADSPWYLVTFVLLAASLILGGWRSCVITAVCIALLRGVGLWNDSMLTLTMTLVATLLVMVLALIFGVWMGRSRAAEAVLRPLLDAGQTLPPFVYLVPALALFGITRFTAIVAAIVYAAPPAIKLVADGIRGVSSTTIEAAQAAGSSRWQIIFKVQLPMARSAIVLAANQGLLYVLSMVVIGGLVGAGALGYLVVAGFSQTTLFGKGLAAGMAIVLLGIMLDRITQHAAKQGFSQDYIRSAAAR
jgi:glycine betaine/proline transport system permease protein